MNITARRPRLLRLCLGILLLSSACQPAQTATPLPVPCPTPDALPVPDLESPTRPAPTPRPSPTPDLGKVILEALPSDPESCLPDRTAEDIGIYIYDLTDGRELVSVNADVPFQYASAFKAPVLVYFLSACRQYWDPSSPEWDAYYHDPEAAKDVPLFTSLEYERLIREFISTPESWNRTGAFFIEHRQMINGKNGEVDDRYFVLEKVYAMIARSSNTATADLLNLIHEACPQDAVSDAQLECGGPNAITGFNTWFNEFTGINYANGEARRGLYSWDTVTGNGVNGQEELVLSTYGLKDTCANRTATLKCDPAYTGFNTYTARDFFTFYQTLYNLQDESLRTTALRLLNLDEPGPSRGYLKNMARSMQAISLSKNGHAFFTNGSINADAGILLYKGRAFVVVTLSFNGIGSMVQLYGSYDDGGNLLGEPGLIQSLLESYSTP